MWFLLIFWVFSRKNDAEYLARITLFPAELFRVSARAGPEWG